MLLSITVCWVASDNFLINEHVCICVLRNERMDNNDNDNNNRS